MADKSSPATCAEYEQLWKDYSDASLKRVRAYGNLTLANLHNDSETMEMLAEAAALADQKLEEVKRRFRNTNPLGTPSKNLRDKRAKKPMNLWDLPKVQMACHNAKILA